MEVQLYLSDVLVLCAEYIPKIIIFYSFAWEYVLPLGIKRDLFGQVNGVSQPGSHEEVDIHLPAFVVIGISIVVIAT